MRSRGLVTLLSGFMFGCLLLPAHNAFAVEYAKLGTTGSSYAAIMPSGSAPSSTLANAGTQVSDLGTFSIVINPDSTLAANSAALAAFNRAASLWASRISDPITVTINASLSDLGNTGTIGSTSTVVLQGGYTTVRNQMVADAATETDDQIVSYLPTAAAFSAALPTGFSLDGYVVSSKASLKAMGFTGLDTQFGTSDATITFNSQFGFDYDNTNGMTSGTMDFETVAAHEIGHALGFISTVDTIDTMIYSSETGSVPLTALDLFRFDNNGSSDPSSTSQFTSYPRSLIPGNDEITDLISTSWGTLSSAEFGMSTGYYTGDGRQASHWKDNDLTNTMVGIMDPTLAYGQINPISEADFRALDLVGYNISAVPEPGTLLLLAIGLPALLAYTRRRRSRQRCIE